MRVVVVAESASTRRRLASLLPRWGIEIVGETAEPREVLAIARRCLPDAVLIDAALVACGGDTNRLLRAELPETKVVVADVRDHRAAETRSAQRL